MFHRAWCVTLGVGTEAGCPIYAGYDGSGHRKEVLRG